MLTRRLMLAGAATLCAGSARAAGEAVTKTVTVVSRPGNVSPEQFLARLAAEYGPLAATLPGQKGLIVSGVAMAQPRTDVVQFGIDPYDAVIESFFGSAEDQDRAAASPAGTALNTALAKLVGAARHFVTRETVVVPLPTDHRPKIVGLTFVMKPPSVSDADFRKEWIVVHGPMAQKVPHLRGFIVSERVSDAPVPGVPPLRMDGPLQGFTESWVDDVQGRAAMMATPEAKAWYAHGAEIFGKIRTDLLIENVLQPVSV